MNIESIKIQILNGKTELPDDVLCKFEDDGRLLLTATKTKIRKVYIKTDISFTDKVKVLSDDFERAYGTLGWKCPSEEVMPWYFFAKENGRIYAFGVKNAPNALCYWKIIHNELYFIADVGSGENPLDFCGNTLEVCTVATEEYSGDSFEAACSFCKKLCNNARIPKAPVYGGNDWYCNYGKNTYSNIISHTKKIAECAEGLENRPYMVIDDGWQLCHHGEYKGEENFNGGPWKYANRKFGDMKKLADEIKSLDVIPGIWMRPLYTVERFPDKYFMKQDGIKGFLDPSVPEVLDIIREDIKTIKDWGYKLIKHDFSTFDIFGEWGKEFNENFTNGVQFADKTKTTAQIIKNMYQAIRESAGNDVMIIGCNTVSHLSAGYFEIQRTGDDTSGRDFEVTKTMGVNTLAFRLPQHNAFYSADADCVGITTQIDWKKNSEWLDVLAKSGTPLFVSIEETAYTDEVKSAIKEAFKIASSNTATATPLDWEENVTPIIWKSAFGTNTYHW